MSKNSEKVIRAIDLGWGYTKFSVPTDQGVVFESMPSLAPRHSGLDLTGSFLSKRNTVVVSVQGTKYEVGPDSLDIDSNDATRNLNESFVFSDQYKAVFLGALHYMNTPVIDRLVMGLPLMNMHLADSVKAMASGKHEVNGVEYTVNEVVVLGQPLGGLNYCLSLKNDEDFGDLAEETSVFVDVGFLTYDFLYSHGNRPVDTRSGAHTGGVSKVLRAMADSISTTYEMKFDNLNAVDRALRRNKLKINGETVAIEPHILAAKGVIEGTVAYMKNIIGSGAEVDCFVLSGGGAFIYRKTLALAYPKHKILNVPDSQMANVKGFYMAGCAIA